MRVTSICDVVLTTQGCDVYVHYVLLFFKGLLPIVLKSYHKVVIYLFLIERVHIVRGGTKTRKQDKLYWFNTLGLIPYCVIVILAIVFRYNALDETGFCYVGLRRESSFPLLIYDLIINVSLAYYGHLLRSTSRVNSSFRCLDYTLTGLHRTPVSDKLPCAP